MVFRDGILLAAQPGAVSGAVLDDLVRKVRALDMDAVRRELDQGCGREATSKTNAAGP
jgi:thioredoxin 1